MGEKWVADLPDLTLLINKIDKLCDDFDPTQFFDNKLYIEKLMKMSKDLKKKKDKSTEKTQKFFCSSKTITLVCFFVFVYFCKFLFDLLNWGNQSLYILLKHLFYVFYVFFCGLFSVKNKYGK